jgi:hypothetical protein
LEQIRQGKRLKNVNERKASGPAPAKSVSVQGFDVAAILQRTMQIRQAVEVSDSEDEDEGDEEAWD